MQALFSSLFSKIRNGTKYHVIIRRVHHTINFTNKDKIRLFLPNIKSENTSSLKCIVRSYLIVGPILGKALDRNGTTNTIR